MDAEYIKNLLARHQSGELDAEALVSELGKMPFEELEFAKLDHHRAMRTGYPEVIFGQGKTPGQAAKIFERLAARNDTVLCTRATPEMASAIMLSTPEAVYHADSRLVELKRREPKGVGAVAVLCAGTSDLPVADEAARVCEAMGSKVERVFDVGVAGIHRLLSHSEVIGRANVLIVVAGMEGALPSVVAGLARVPVIAVPTSVGYGASFGGLAALLAMLNSCATGVSVVNIDNGFGAAVQADMINKLACGAKRCCETAAGEAGGQ